MKFLKYLEFNAAPGTHDKYVCYEQLKRQVSSQAKLRSHFGRSVADVKDTSLLEDIGESYAERMREEENKFFALLNEDVERVNALYLASVQSCKDELRVLQRRADRLVSTSPFNRKDAQNLERDFVSFYRGLDVLKNYATVNSIGFLKILRKHDQTLGLVSGEAYSVTVLGTQAFRSTEAIPKMCHDTEKLFASVFEHNNLRRAMSRLRRWHKQRTHWSSFAVGVTTGMSVVLIVVLVVLIFLPPSVTSIPNYFENFVVFRLFGLVILQFFFWACNIWVWKRNRVNFVHIFEFNQQTVLSHVQICLGLGTVYLFCFVCFVGFSKGIILHTSCDKYVAVWFPVALIVLFVAWVVFPLNYFWRSSRFYLMRLFVLIILAPLTKVRFAVFFVADVMTSLVKPLCDIEYVLCFYFSGNFLDLDEGSNSSCKRVNSIVFPILTVFPYWIRFLQCVRRFVDTRRFHPHLTNAGKYASCCTYIVIAAVHSAVTGSSERWDWSEIMWLVAIVVTTVYTYVWDVTMDWGFGRFRSSNFVLRDSLMYLNRWVYYWAIVSDGVLRCCWVLTITPVALIVQQDYVLFFLAAAEIFRRSQWAVFRLENAYVQDLDEYRSTSLIPVVIDTALNEKHERRARGSSAATETSDSRERSRRDQVSINEADDERLDEDADSNV